MPADTIFAVSSGQPPAAIAVIRISGPHALGAATLLTQRLPEPRRAGLRRLTDPVSGEVLDDVLVLVFPGPNTATGEDLVELHAHGGRAVVAGILGSLSRIDGLRAAEAGEFTRRALMNGRMDLTEAEGLGDLLQAETEAQRRAAQQGSGGRLRRQVEAWAEALLAASASVEALIDHSDESDVDASAVADVQVPIQRLAAELDAALAQPPVERLKDGVRVVLAGPPNAGKSSLINALADRQVAIVSTKAGTTRDRIEASVIRAGLAWVLTDTAGLRDGTDDEIEREGIALANAAVQQADLVVWLGDEAPPVEALWVHARCDEPGREEKPVGPVLSVSVRTGQGIDRLWTALGQRAASLTPTLDGLAFNLRQRSLLEGASASLAAALAERDTLLLADELRSARSFFDRITGQAGVESVLDTLFGRFCIGK